MSAPTLTVEERLTMIRNRIVLIWAALGAHQGDDGLGADGETLEAARFAAMEAFDQLQALEALPSSVQLMKVPPQGAPTLAVVRPADEEKGGA